MTAADLRSAHGPDRIDKFRWARGVLSQNATLTTFDNSFTDRLGLSAVEDKAADISYLLPLLLGASDSTGAAAALTAASTLLL